MNSDTFFRAPEEELARLNSELAEIRRALQDLSGQLNQIERHVKRAFGVAKPPKSSGSASRAARAVRATMSSGEALELFRELTELSRVSGFDALEQRLQNLSIPDLKLLAHELGVSFPSKPSRKAIQAGVRGRVSESIMLSQNRNVTTALSERESPGGFDAEVTTKGDEST